MFIISKAIILNRANRKLMRCPVYIINYKMIIQDNELPETGVSLL
jgi:hypothetical protein